MLMILWFIIEKQLFYTVFETKIKRFPKPNCNNKLICWLVFTCYSLWALYKDCQEFSHIGHDP